MEVMKDNENRGLVLSAVVRKAGGLILSAVVRRRKGETGGDGGIFIPQSEQRRMEKKLGRRPLKFVGIVRISTIMGSI